MASENYERAQRCAELCAKIHIKLDGGHSKTNQARYKDLYREGLSLVDGPVFYEMVRDELAHLAEWPPQ